MEIRYEQPVYIRYQLYLALLGLRGVHIFPHTYIPEYLRRVVFMQGIFVALPYVEVLLAYAEQHGDIFLSDYVSLAEHRVLCNSFYYLGYVVAQHAAHGVLCSDKLHVFLPLTSCFRYSHL